MLDLSLPELGVIGLVALVVLGPERLPKVARFAGLWVRRARAQWYSVKSELERELEAEELQRSLRNVREEAEDFGAQIRAAGEETRKDFESMREALNDARRARPVDARIGALVDGDPQTAVGHDRDAAGDTPRVDDDSPDDRRDDRHDQRTDPWQDAAPTLDHDIPPPSRDDGQR